VEQAFLATPRDPALADLSWSCDCYCEAGGKFVWLVDVESFVPLHKCTKM
jgi:hypothetical protein